MQIKNFIEKLKTMEHEQLFTWLLLIFSVATLIAILVFAFYFMNFNSELSTDQNIWGVFGDFIGGTLNPIFSFLSLTALLLTIILQSKELKETTKALQESARAQQEMQIAQTKQAKAMEISARMTAITKLLEQNEETLNEQNLHKTASATTIDVEIKSFNKKKMQLRKDLDDLYSELINMHVKSSEQSGQQGTDHD